MPENEPPTAPTATSVSLRYAGPSGLRESESGNRLALFGNLARDPVSFDGRLKDPLPIREALSALHAVVGSDYRYVPRDRTAYNAYQRMRRQSANLDAWRAQQAYFDWLWRNDPLAWCILDPVITVHPDQIFFEVFSKDESTYANLSIHADAFDITSQPTYGTTNIDFSERLHDNTQRFRSYRQTRLTIGQQAVELETQDVGTVLEKKIAVPDSWLRGFLQVQSAASLPTETLSLSPIDLYNALRHLRMHRDIKGRRRGVRVELVPGERPRLVLEPWETVIESTAGVYTGTTAKVVRVWGRRRLSLLRRMLPIARSVDVHLTGSGLPSFWVLRSELMTFTMGLTGFTASNWSKALDFDLLLPRAPGEADGPLKKILQVLSKQWAADLAQLSKSTKLTGEDLVGHVQLGCQQGQIMVDLPRRVYRLRPLMDQPLDLPRLQYRGDNERLAFDLLSRKGAVAITRENRIAGSGLELTGRTKVAEDRREYRPQMLIGDEGFVSRAECSCNQYRTSGLKAGPCTHLIALRLAHGQRQQQRRAGRGGPVTVETRTYCRRDDSGQDEYQLMLDHKQLKIRWGRIGDPPRVQQFRYATETAARNDYKQRIDRLVAGGFLDASS